MKDLGYGDDYVYPHDHEGHFSGQRNLPEEIALKQFYFPSKEGYEKVVQQRLDNWWKPPNQES